MTKRQRTLADFYASLASIRPESADKQLAPLLPRFARILASTTTAASYRASKPSKATLLAALAQVQRETATVLRALLRDQTAAIPTPLRTVPPRWHLANRHVTEVWELDAMKLSPDKQLALRALTPLVELVRLPRFPFGLCSVCDRVFVRVRRQRYCSPACTYKGSEAERRDERREYMRTYMKQWRAERRTRRQKEK